MTTRLANRIRLCSRSLLLFFLLVLPLLGMRPSGGQSSSSGGSYYCSCLNYSGPSTYSAGDPVELWRGTCEWSQTDLAVPGPLPIRLRRHHCSLDFSPGPFGAGSSMDYDYFVLRTAQGPQVIGPKNRRALFSFPYYSNECTNNTDPQYAGAKLQFTGNGLEATLTFPGGVIWSFNTAGALVSIRNRLGVGLNFARNANGYLTAITNTLNNFAIHLSYGPNGLVESASTYPDGRTVTYSYDTNGCLTSVQDTAGGVTRYTWTELVFGSYHGYGIATVTDPRGVQILANTYDTGTQRISSQRLGNGGTFRFAYQGQSDGSQITRVTDPNGNAIDVHLEPTQGYSYRLRSVRDALGRTTTFHYPSSGPSFITGITDFRGT